MVDTPLSILHIITRLDLGGSAENTLLTALGSANVGHRVTIISGYSSDPPSQTEKKAIHAGIIIIKTAHLVRNISVINDAIALLFIIRHLLKNRPDIVHTHTSKAGIIGRIAARLAGVHRVVHTPHGHVFYGYFSLFLTKVFIILERLMVPLTDVHISLTQNEKDDYLSRHIGKPDDFIPIYSGIPLEMFLKDYGKRDALRKEWGFSGFDIIVGTVARLVPIKNHSLIVEAAAILCKKYPTIQFVFVGDGELRQPLEEHARSLQVEQHIVFTGWRNDIPELLSAFDIFALCSKNEGMGRAFVEAQAAGVPAIGSRVCGIPEVIKEGETGYLVSSTDPMDLASHIEQLFLNRNALAQMKSACREWVYPKFSVEAMVDKINAIYEMLMVEG
jgi:glycosyltransferase involved in cell wall biosynthesis